jgi:hypothetical protein
MVTDRVIEQRDGGVLRDREGGEARDSRRRVSVYAWPIQPCSHIEHGQVATKLSDRRRSIVYDRSLDHRLFWIFDDGKRRVNVSRAGVHRDGVAIDPIHAGLLGQVCDESLKVPYRAVAAVEIGNYRDESLRRRDVRLSIFRLVIVVTPARYCVAQEDARRAMFGFCYRSFDCSATPPSFSRMPFRRSPPPLRRWQSAVGKALLAKRR